MDVDGAAAIVEDVRCGKIQVHTGPISLLGAEALFTSSTGPDTTTYCRPGGYIHPQTPAHAAGSVPCMYELP